MAGTLHVVVVEGNYCATWRAFCQLFHPLPSLLSVSVDLHQVFLCPLTLFLPPWKPRKYHSGRDCKLSLHSKIPLSSASWDAWLFRRCFHLALTSRVHTTCHISHIYERQCFIGIYLLNRDKNKGVSEEVKSSKSVLIKTGHPNILQG